MIATPYIKCRELCGQIGNLRKKVSGTGFKEERISKSINRDMWSATKYALRVAQRLEYQNLVSSIKRNNAWTKAIKFGMPSVQEAQNESEIKGYVNTYGVVGRTINRTGGNMRR